MRGGRGRRRTGAKERGGERGPRVPRSEGGERGEGVRGGEGVLGGGVSMGVQSGGGGRGEGVHGGEGVLGGEGVHGGGAFWGYNPVAAESPRTTICWVPRRTLRIIRKAFSPLVCFSRTTNSIPALAAATTSGSVTLTGVPAPEVSLRRLPSLSTAYSELYSSTVSP